MSGGAANAFCCVRPPGHHAEPDKAMGFCFFNNAPIGALHAKVRLDKPREARQRTASVQAITRHRQTDRQEDTGKLY